MAKRFFADITLVLIEKDPGVERAPRDRNPRVLERAEVQKGVLFERGRSVPAGIVEVGQFFIDHIVVKVQEESA